MHPHERRRAAFGEHRIRKAVALLAAWLALAAPAAAQLTTLGAGAPLGSVSAPTYIESETANNATGTATMTWSASPASGQLLLACCIGQYGDAFTAPASPVWTNDYSSTANYGTACWHRIAGASEPTSNAFTNGTSVNIGCGEARFSGNSASAPQFSENNVNGTAATATSITPTATYSIPFAFFLGASIWTSYTTPSGYTSEATIGSGSYGGVMFLGPTITTITGQAPTSTAGNTNDNWTYLYVINHP